MSEHPAEFKVMQPHRTEETREYNQLGCPRFVPWDMVKPHQQQAHTNHGQTLERLNQRGGLDPGEMVAILTGTSWSKIDPNATVSVPKLKALLAEYLEATAKRFGWMFNDPQPGEEVQGSFATYAEALADAYRSMRSAGCNSTTILIGEMLRPDFLGYMPQADDIVDQAGEQFTGSNGSCDDPIFDLTGDRQEATDELREALKEWAEKWVENNVKWWLNESDCEELHIRADDEETP